MNEDRQEYECENCVYYEQIHKDYKKIKEKCKTCQKPIRNRLDGHGIYNKGESYGII